MAPRALWKGFLKVAELSCAVGLYSAVSKAERISFHMVDRDSGHRLARQFVDEETGREVPREAQVKGYDTGGGTVVLEPDEVASVVPESTRTLAVEGFLACDDIEPLYFDTPYYLGPADKASAPAFALIREAMRTRKVAAIARTVLFRRLRTVLIRPAGTGFTATTLHFDYEVRSATEAFEDVPDVKVDKEMLDLARHIIKTKSGGFDPEDFEDRYEAALTDLVKAKISGRTVRPRKAAPPAKVVSLMDALRRSAGADATGGRGGKTSSKASGKAPAKKSRTSAAKSAPAKASAGKSASAGKAAAKPAAKGRAKGTKAAASPPARRRAS
ncbi:non-homologous end joining protein Ku [Azorhizobium oxalatiphilum]|uniref:Non-homologous end joining protein Ku n=1 Tax=Azorhizobium oxalatiphilum TaxID=980631 RepID=A0A917C8T7_9HYPH|nr:Ku protein [Azorhizobium oxalatiphilum]GGF78403.1 non-homologous end joining protein Ku [Azorhizobium oxalatiphilum]